MSQMPITGQVTAMTGGVMYIASIKNTASRDLQILKDEPETRILREQHSNANAQSNASSNAQSQQQSSSNSVETGGSGYGISAGLSVATHRSNASSSNHAQQHAHNNATQSSVSYAHSVPDEPGYGYILAGKTKRFTANPEGKLYIKIKECDEKKDDGTVIEGDIVQGGITIDASVFPNWEIIQSSASGRCSFSK